MTFAEAFWLRMGNETGRPGKLRIFSLIRVFAISTQPQSTN